MRARAILAVTFLFSGLCFACRAQDEPKPYAELNGNWRLTGEHSLAQSPYLAVVLGVSGNLVYGEGQFTVMCSGVVGVPVVSGWFSVAGKIEQDGTFLLTDVAAPRPGIKIWGTVPGTGELAWSGSFSITAFVKVRSGSEPTQSCA